LPISNIPRGAAPSTEGLDYHAVRAESGSTADSLGAAGGRWFGHESDVVSQPVTPRVFGGAGTSRAGRS
jgi:hypothetical protein